MADYNFFDCIRNPNNSFSSAVDDYFYLDGISRKLGSKKFVAITPKLILQNSNAPKITFWSVLLTIIKIASYFTVIVPLAFLTFKAGIRGFRKFSLYTPLIPRRSLLNPTTASKYLLGIETPYKKYRSSWHAHFYLHNMLHDFKLDSQQTIFSSIHADCGFGSLYSKFDGDKDVKFLHAESLNPSIEDQMKTLIESLQAAFSTGTKLVLVRLSSSKHATAAAFQSDGRFKIIDSMKSGTVDIDLLTLQLNLAQIRNRQGTPIHFDGDYVNTRLQPTSDNVCMRLATLYAYHIGKTHDLEAYQEVNGAFAEGRLKTFEDHVKISGAKKIKSFSSANRDLYKAFTSSWAYRALMCLHDDWKKVQVSELNVHPLRRNFTFLYVLRNNPKHPSTDFSVEHVDHIINANPQNKIELIWKKNNSGQEQVISDIDDLKHVFKEISVTPQTALEDLKPVHNPAKEMFTFLFIQPTGTNGQQRKVFSASLDDCKGLYRRGLFGVNKSDEPLQKAFKFLNN